MPLDWPSSDLRPHKKAVVWPWWLLVVAWLCANTPQTGLCHVIDWLAQARTFSHQQRLTVQVAELLGGQADADDASSTLSTAAQPDERPAPVTSASSALKKVDLSLERQLAVRAPDAPAVLHPPERKERGTSRGDPPAHRPPRGQALPVS